VTDWFDGFLARRWNQTSSFGAFLDPVADKLMVAGALLVLVQLDRVNAVIAFVIIGREITISALREWMALIGASKSVAVSSLGKIKTTAQMAAIPMLLYYDLFIRSGRRFAGFVVIADCSSADGLVDVLLPEKSVAADQGKHGKNGSIEVMCLTNFSGTI
jgi:cardiolipin synthase